ncbi:hypothetical protein E4T42_09261 [Aureobasidium subglaciale]|nr:hypothetical protein E4T42_09261 [Aureobasidium subglaciale]
MINHVTHHALELYATSLPGCSSSQQKLFNELVTTLHEQELQSLAAQHHAIMQQPVSAQQNVSAQRVLTIKPALVMRRPPKIKLEPMDRSNILFIEALPHRHSRAFNTLAVDIEETDDDTDDEVDFEMDFSGCESANESDHVPVDKYVDDRINDREAYDAEIANLMQFCPISLSTKGCPHREKCTLKKVCYFNTSRPKCRKDGCEFSHDVMVTCRDMICNGHCKREECRYSHGQVRKIMTMFAEDHSKGVYGVAKDESSTEAVTAHTEEVSAEAETAQGNETSVEV